MSELLEKTPRLEFVVKGARQTAFETAPERPAAALRAAGIVVEQRSGGDFEMPDHWLPGYLLTVSLPPTHGRRYWFESGKEQHIDAYSGCTDVVPPQEMRKMRYEGEFRTVHALMSPDLLQGLAAESSPRSALELVRNMRLDDAQLRQLVLDLHSDLTVGSTAGILRAESISYRLGEHLLNKYSIGRVRLDHNHGGIAPNALRRVVEYIDSNLGADLKTEDIARVAGLSKYHCGKAFAKTTGTSLHAYVLGRRIARARELLRRSDESIAQIAAAVGFSSQSHFTTTFVTRTGSTPAVFRHRRAF